MFAYCLNNPCTLCDPLGTSPFGPLNIGDYYTIHKKVQDDVQRQKGWLEEISVKGPKGRGRLDLYDKANNVYYEVKSEGAAYRPSTERQMQKYDVAEISGMASLFISQEQPATRGTEYVSGSFEYGFWDVNYSLEANGLIVYEPTYNFERMGASLATALVVGLVAIAAGFGIPLAIPGVGN